MVRFWGLSCSGAGVGLKDPCGSLINQDSLWFCGRLWVASQQGKDPSPEGHTKCMSSSLASVYFSMLVDITDRYTASV